MSKVIGGEFALRSDQLTGNEPKSYNGYLYASGRSALHYIVRQLISEGTKRIWLPDYLCSSITETLQKLSIEILFYRLDEYFMPDFSSFNIERCDSFMLINYFGLQKTEDTVLLLKQEYATLQVIVDNVQAYFEMNPDSIADYQFTSFRKTLGAVDGGWVLTRNKILAEPTDPNNFSHFKMAGALLKEISQTIPIQPFVYLQLIEDGETMIIHDYEKAMHCSTLSYLSTIDYGAVKAQRRSNARYVIEELDKIHIHPVIDIDLRYSVPLFVPILLENRDSVRGKLRENGIFCPIHWSTLEKAYKKGIQMSEQELSLVIDQRYTPSDLVRMMDIIKANV